MKREKAKEILTHNLTRVDNPNYSESELDEAFFMAIEALKPKTGEWILLDHQSTEEMENGNYYYFCSNCLHEDVHAETQEVPYCWYCGARMLGEDGEEE